MEAHAAAAADAAAGMGAAGGATTAGGASSAGATASASAAAERMRTAAGSAVGSISSTFSERVAPKFREGGAEIKDGWNKKFVPAMSTGGARMASFFGTVGSKVRPGRYPSPHRRNALELSFLSSNNFTCRGEQYLPGQSPAMTSTRV
jgi:hypothetical protein